MFSLSAPHVLSRSENIDSLEAQLKAVDIEAFLTLVDHRDEAFLHHTLEPAAFRRIHRLRIRAALKYLQRLLSNVSILLQIGTLASRSADPATAEAGGTLADTALRTRFLILQTYCRLVARLIVPMYSARGVGQLFSEYSEISRQLTRLTRFHVGATARLSLQR